MPVKTATTFTDVPVDTLIKRVNESKQYRKKYEALWDKSRDFYDGKQWASSSKIAWFQSDPVYNKVAEYVEIMRGYLSDNKWGVDAIPAAIPEGTGEQSINDMAGKVNKLLDFLWVDNRTQNKLAQVLQYVFLYGTGFIKSTFDPDNIGDGGIGQIETTVLSPWYIFPDPDASDIHNAAYIIEHHPVTLRWVIDRYPQFAKQVKDSGESSSTEYYERKGDGTRGPAPTDEGRRLDIYECWYRDSSVSEDLDGEGNATLAYPNGRHTLMTAGGIVLDDSECLYSMWPYVRFVDIPRPAEFFGDCTVHKALGIQENINTILRALIDNGLWLIHGIWIADSTSGVTSKSLAGYGPRATIIKNPGTEVRRDSGEALPQHIFQMLDQQVTAFDKVVGLPDVLRGIVPSRQPVQTVMMQQESGEVRTRERQRRCEEALADLGQLWVDIVANHWNDKRVVRNKKALGGFDMFQISKKDFDEWRWDIHIVPGSTAPMDKQGILSMLAEATSAFGLQIPPDFIVRLMSIPGLEAAVMEQEQAILAEESAVAGPQEPSQMPTEVVPSLPEEGAIDPTLNIPPDILAQMAGAGGGTPTSAAQMPQQGIQPPIDMTGMPVGSPQIDPTTGLPLGY
jgi:hypothetical protein